MCGSHGEDVCGNPVDRLCGVLSYYRPLRTYEYKAARVTDFGQSSHLRTGKYKSGNDYKPDTPTIKHPKPWDSTFYSSKSLMPRKQQVEERLPNPYQDPTAYQYGSLPHILGLKGRLYMSKRAKTAWLAKKNPRGHNSSRGTHRLVSSPIRSTHRSRHDYDAM